jgi:translation initiation factor 4G
MARQGDPLLSLEIPLTQIDLNGGNGKWRQIKAEEEFARKAEERKEQRRQEIIKEKEKQKRREELADRRKKHHEEEERRWQEEREQKHRAKLEEERIKREQEEKLRLEREAAEAERLRRMPRPCEVCEGTGKCQDCNGKGYSFSIFLVPSVSGELPSLGGTNMDHGRVYQGCGNCGGYAHNMLGDLKKGSGQCPACNGTGKIWPVIDAAGAGETSPKAKTTNIQSLAGSMEMFRQL